MDFSKIFQDLVVLELASVLAGPGVGMFFAELGARVIKVESPATNGDVTRSWKLPSEKEAGDRPAYYLSTNWGKESLAIDLKKAEGKAIIHQLIRKVDVVLVSYKPGDAQKLGMDHSTLSALNAALIYAELTAYGPKDPRPGFDAIIQAEAGFTFMNGEPDGNPVKMPVALMDLLAAHQLKEGILLALIHRMRTGEGQKISTSLLASGVASLANQGSNFLNAGHIPQRMGSDHPNIVPYGTIFTTSDGKPVVVAVGNNRQFARLCSILQIGELAEKDRFQTNPSRVLHREELQNALAEAFAKVDRASLLKACAEQKVPVGAVNNMQEVFDQPLAQQMILKAETEGREVFGVRTIALDGLSAQPQTPPHFGAQTAALLHEFLEMDAQILSDLQDKNIIPHS